MEDLEGLVGRLEWVQEEQAWYLGLVDQVDLVDLEQLLNLEKVCCLEFL